MLNTNEEGGVYMKLDIEALAQIERSDSATLFL